LIQDIAPYKFDNQYHELEPRDEDTVCLFAGSTILMHTEDDSVELPKYADFKAESQLYKFRYLFSIDENRFFLASPLDRLQKGTFSSEQIDSKVHDEFESELDGFKYMGISSIRAIGLKHIRFALSVAYHLYVWYRDNRYCGRCGCELSPMKKERGLVCDSCGNMVFPKIAPATIIAVTDGDRLVLTKYKGRSYHNYALVAGYVEIGETIEECVIREVKEEVGLDVANVSYYKSQPWGFSGTLLAGFFCELVGDDKIKRQEDELAEAVWMKASEIDLKNDGVSLTYEMIEKFVKEHNK